MAIDQKIERKIKALMSRAAGTSNEHEADACRARALEIAARYGVEMSKLETEENNEVTRHDITFSGAYTDMQFLLFNQLGRVLHCYVVCFKAHRSSRVEKAVIFGRKNHIDRVLMLHSMLSPHMMAEAAKAYRANPTMGVSAQTAKRSWMTGFVVTISERLQQLEDSMTNEYSRTDIHGTTRTGEVVLLDDKAKAEELAKKHYQNIGCRQAFRRKLDAGSYTQGSDAGQNTDIGQTRVQRGKVAISR